MNEELLIERLKKNNVIKCGKCDKEIFVSSNGSPAICNECFDKERKK